MTLAYETPQQLAVGTVEKPPRILSVDVLRGLVMFTMVFVNDVAGVQNAPWWMKHYFPYEASGMTFVDVVFPAFLFIVGMSVPLAFESRRRKGEIFPITLLHVLLRTLELLLLGFVTVNIGSYSPNLWMKPVIWKTLVSFALILTFVEIGSVRKARGNDDHASKRVRVVNWIFRGVGAAILIFLVAIFRNKAGNWMTPQWWGILGLIGWAYLVCSVAWMLSFNLRPLLYVFAAATMGLYVYQSHGTFDSLWISKWVNIGEQLGSHASIAIMGAIVGSMLRRDSLLQSHATRLSFAAELVVVLSVLAILMHKPWGINKNDATPAWCLWSSAITTALWMLLYAIVDVAQLRKWSWFFASAGSCALMIYLLHPLFYHVISLTGWTTYGHWGKGDAWMGICRAIGCAIAMCSLAIGLAKIGVRLKL